ncbi:MAG: ric methyltransferase [Cellvibrio sp.]|nr:ric methyltransferase [Cellvibrio sp.]
MHTGHSMLRKIAESNLDASAIADPQCDLKPLYRLIARTPNLREGDEASMRRVLRNYFLDTFTTYESLFECLANDQAFYTKPISLRHPLIFYYGHTAITNGRNHPK